MRFSERKAALRDGMLGLRAGCDPALGARLAAHVLGSGIVPAGARVGGFWPMRGEIDIRPLLETLHARGHVLALPETPRAGQPLIFRAWKPGDELVRGRYGTMHPSGAEIAPDFLLIPLVAFDAQGNRLGYGGGYYDRTLAALPGAFRLGCGYAMQEIADIPTEETDLPLHAMATEAGVIHF